MAPPEHLGSNGDGLRLICFQVARPYSFRLLHSEFRAPTQEIPAETRRRKRKVTAQLTARYALLVTSSIQN
jgi:hypothetical protein